MKLNKLAGLGIVSIVLFGSVVESSINAQPAQALEVKQSITGKAKLLNISSRHRVRNGLKRNFNRYGRRNFKRRFGLKRHGRRNRGLRLELNKAFSTGNNFDERIIRVRLF